eukprot:05273.XXX_280992_281213_1 [CDS] Oithona nana genome sequencing.
MSETIAASSCSTVLVLSSGFKPAKQTSLLESLLSLSVFFFSLQEDNAEEEFCSSDNSNVHHCRPRRLLDTFPW